MKKLIFGLFLICSIASAKGIYVDGVAGNDANSGTKSSPVKTPFRGLSLASPGDTVFVMPTTTYGNQYFNKSGTAAAPITIRGGGSLQNKTKIVAPDNFGILVETGTAYLNLENFDIQSGDNTTVKGQRSGFYIKGHHIVIRNNYTHDNGCAGIQTYGADWVTIDRNVVAYNAKNTTQNVWCSGISTHENKDIDSFTGTKMRITNNIVYGNTNTVLPGCTTCTNSDGSGIIIDDSRRSQTDYNSYKGKHLIENNVIWNNGGRGLAIYFSDNCLVRGNTMFHNNQDPAEGAYRPGEISIVQSGGIDVYNNVLYSDGLAPSSTGQHYGVNADTTTGGPINIDYNLFYNPQNNSSYTVFNRNNKNTITIGTHSKFGDPKFKTASTDSSADLRPLVGTAATGFASPLATFGARDIEGVLRVTPLTVGAYVTTISP